MIDGDPMRFRDYIAALGHQKKFNKRITWTRIRKKIVANVISLRLKRKEKRGLN
jgi:hypothetical protein